MNPYLFQVASAALSGFGFGRWRDHDLAPGVPDAQSSPLERVNVRPGTLQRAQLRNWHAAEGTRREPRTGHARKPGSIRLHTRKIPVTLLNSYMKP
jgi:hypothetical protein